MRRPPRYPHTHTLFPHTTPRRSRALPRAVAGARGPRAEAPPPATDTTDHTNSVLPDVLTAPLQHAPAGGPGTASLPPRVPPPIAGQGEPAPQEDRKSVGQGTSVSVTLDLGGRRIIYNNIYSYTCSLHHSHLLP